MKSMLIAVLMASVAGWARAETVGDDFDDNTIDPALWGPQVIVGPIGFNESIQRINYEGMVAAGAAAMPWVANRLPYNSDWEIRFSVYNGAYLFNNGEQGAFGFGIQSDLDTNDTCSVITYAKRTAALPMTVMGFRSDFVNNAKLRGSGVNNLNIRSGLLRLEFDSATKILNAYVGTNSQFVVTNNYVDVFIGSFGIAGTGGSITNANWGMTDTNTFTVAILGAHQVLTGGAASFGDNFEMTGRLDPIQVNMTPATATNVTNTQHTVTATVTSNSVALAGVTINFEIISGPNTGQIGLDTTDVNGRAYFTYIGGATLGTDTIEATGTVDVTDVSDEVTCEWVGALPVADLVVAKSANKTQATINRKLTYTVAVTNMGPDTATGVVVTDTLPVSSVLVPGSTTPGYTLVGRSLTFDLGSMGAGTGTNLVVAIKPKATGKIVNKINVLGNEPDPNTTNNFAKAKATVVP